MAKNSHRQDQRKLSQEEFERLTDQLLVGSDEAARELVQHYQPELIRLVRHLMSRKLRAKFDSHDFTQDVWTAFFAGVPHPKRFERPKNLAWFLKRLAHNKVVDTARQRLQGEKFNIDREQAIDPSRLTGHHASPSTVLMSQEEWDRLIQSQPPVYQQILMRTREGKSTHEISGELDLSERTVRRVVKKLLPGLTQ